MRDIIGDIIGVVSLIFLFGYGNMIEKNLWKYRIFIDIFISLGYNIDIENICVFMRYPKRR